MAANFKRPWRLFLSHMTSFTLWLSVRNRRTLIPLTSEYIGLTRAPQVLSMLNDMLTVCPDSKPCLTTRLPSDHGYPHGLLYDNPCPVGHKRW